MSSYACCVPGCVNKRATNEITLFKLPYDGRRGKWLKAIKREDLLDVCNKNYVICSEHFERKMIIEKRMRKLVKNAIPTINIPGWIEPIIIQLNPIQSTSTTIMDPIEPTPGIIELNPGTIELNPGTIEPTPRIIEPTSGTIEPTPGTIEPIESNPTINLNSGGVSTAKYLETTMINPGEVIIVSGAELFSQSASLMPTKIVSDFFDTEDDFSPQSDEGNKEIKLEMEVENDQINQGYFIQENLPKTQDPADNDNYSEFTVLHKLEPKSAETKCIKTDDSCICKSFDPVLKKKYQILLKVKTDLLNTTREEYLSIAFNLRINNPNMYKMLYSTLQLPNDSILKRINVQVSSRLDEIRLKLISTKLKSMEHDAKYCSLLVSRVKITPQLYYMIDRDEVIGMQDIVDGEVSNELANYAFVAIIQGLKVNWSMPVAFSFVAKNHTHALIHYWIQNIVILLFSIGVDIKAIVVPFDFIFQEIAKLYYENTMFITDINATSSTSRSNHTLYCYTFVEIDRKIYYMFDMSDLISRLINDLKKKDHYVDNKIISWDYLQPIYTNDLNPFLFSSEVCTILYAYIDHEVIPKSGLPTVNFINSMTKIIEKLLSEKFKEFPLVFDRKYKDTLQNLQAILLNIKYKRNGQEFYSVSCTAISIVLNTIKELRKELIDLKISLIPSRIHLKTLNIFLDSVRNLRGRIVNPSPVKFLRAFRRNLVKSLLNTDGQSVKEEPLDLQYSWDPASYLITQKRNSRVSLQKNTSYRIEIPRHEPIRYMASYFIYECCKVHTECKELQNTINNLPNLETVTHYDEYFSKYNTEAEFYGKLKVPPQAFVVYIETVEDVVNKYIVSSGVKHPTGFGAGALDIILRSSTFVSPCPCFPLNYLLTLFIRMKIYHVCTARNKYIKMNRMPQKITILD